MERRTVPQENPEEGARREMLAALQRTLSSEEWGAYEAVLNSKDEEAMREAIAAFNVLNAGTPDSEEFLAEREGETTINLVNGRELRIMRSKRGKFELSSPGTH